MTISKASIGQPSWPTPAIREFGLLPHHKRNKGLAFARNCYRHFLTIRLVCTRACPYLQADLPKPDINRSRPQANTGNQQVPRIGRSTFKALPTVVRFNFVSSYRNVLVNGRTVSRELFPSLLLSASAISTFKYLSSALADLKGSAAIETGAAV